MSISKYVSEVKLINQNNAIVYNYLSDFTNLGQFFNEHTIQKISEQIPKANITNFNVDTESCHFSISGMGEAGFRIMERVAPKTIKITGEGKIPFELFFWIQVLPASAYQCKLRLTLHANLNMMMKMVVGKKMNDGINRMAEAIAQMPFR